MYLYFNKQGILLGWHDSMSVNYETKQIVVETEVAPLFSEEGILLPQDQQRPGWPAGVSIDAGVCKISRKLKKLSANRNATLLADKVRRQISPGGSSRRRDGWIAKALCACFYDVTGDPKFLEPFEKESSIDGRTAEDLRRKTIDKLVRMATSSAGAESIENKATADIEASKNSDGLDASTASLLQAASTLAAELGHELK